MLGLFLVLLPLSTNLALIKQLGIRWADVTPAGRAVVILSCCASLALMVVGVKDDWFAKPGDDGRMYFFTSGATDASAAAEQVIVATFRSCYLSGPKTTLASVKVLVDGSRLSAQTRDRLEEKWLEDAALLPDALQDSRRKVVRLRGFVAVQMALLAATCVALYA